MTVVNQLHKTVMNTATPMASIIGPVSTLAIFSEAALTRMNTMIPATMVKHRPQSNTDAATMHSARATDSRLVGTTLNQVDAPTTLRSNPALVSRRSLLISGT